MPSTRRKTTRTRKPSTSPSLAKVATGIDGFDEITGGGLPEGRPTLVCGGPGCGKTLFALQFLVHGATRGESGVFVAFEETEEDLLKNAASLFVDFSCYPTIETAATLDMER
jgi:circadian clock protein KaiC